MCAAHTFPYFHILSLVTHIDFSDNKQFLWNKNEMLAEHIFVNVLA